MTSARSGGWLGLGIAAVLGLWWLAAAQFALQNGFDAATASTDLLDALWLTRMLVILLLAPVAGMRCAQWRGLQPILCVAWMSWPLVVLGAAAAAVPWQRVLLSELTVLSAASLAYGAGWALRRSSAVTRIQDPVGFAFGAGLAALVWANRTALLPGWVT